MTSVNSIMATLLLVVSLLSCQDTAEKRVARQNPTRSCTTAICKEYREARLDDILKASTIKALSESYAADPWKSNIYKNQSDTKQDALSIVFDLEKIKALVYLMESQKCMANCSDKFELGIRYYYIKYPPRTGHDQQYPDLADLGSDAFNKHSLAMVPVYRKKGDSVWVDYNPWSSKKGSCFPAIDFADTDIKTMFRAIAPDAGENHGSIGPPPEPGTFGAQEEL